MPAVRRRGELLHWISTLGGFNKNDPAWRGKHLTRIIRGRAKGRAAARLIAAAAAACSVPE